MSLPKVPIVFERQWLLPAITIFCTSQISQNVFKRNRSFSRKNILPSKKKKKKSLIFKANVVIYIYIYSPTVVNQHFKETATCYLIRDAHGGELYIKIKKKKEKEKERQKHDIHKNLIFIADNILYLRPRSFVEIAFYILYFIFYILYCYKNFHLNTPANTTIL
jgi:hypothetical protein